MRTTVKLALPAVTFAFGVGLLSGIAHPQTAKADACADVGGRVVSVGGCTDPARWGNWVLPAGAMTVPPPGAPPPCYTPSGEPYWTPPGEPC
ncbi:hypothetical protein BN971_03530 [Mycobacterium bohemicum DSM 44277]|uniref:Secreted protein n=1 Tax=Mycobacterium bohemicum DSM 44277 TaxID=1236609 RepID=A0A0U0WB25_MYCBE|nr:hypothetical protein [Mycobacterium bohemicum]CPR12236.1 hypothetical protein BN971_03530 [Mycobacterium bohemicum DSM 44277]